MWKFCLQSLFSEYGWQFIRQMALPHPVRTTKAILNCGTLEFSDDMPVMCIETPGRNLEGAHSIVGVGFCLKPMNPPCPSGRSNHDCHYLEHLHHAGVSDIPIACRHCIIREIGIMALKTSAVFYIMTSARDILFDVFKPAITEGKFSSGLFLLCRYSLRPFAVGLLASGIRGRLFTFETGDCRDYKTWLMADRGIKEEQTGIDERTQRTIRELLMNADLNSMPDARFERQGNVFYTRTKGVLL